MQEIRMIQHLSELDYQMISDLEAICLGHDQTALKLELDYKLAVSNEHSRESLSMKSEHNENGNISKDDMHVDFLYFADKKLVGYLGICSFGGQKPELNGMVDPSYRRQGIFSKLYALGVNELYRHDFEHSLLICDRKSQSGQNFIRFIAPEGLKKAHSEYEMFLNYEKFKSVKPSEKALLRKSTNEDAMEIAKQNAIYFGQPLEETSLIMPETEEKRGMTVYLAYLDEVCIGKIHLELSKGIGGIYGVGILPEYRGRGYGRLILLEGIGILMNRQAEAIKLQVEAENENALSLYSSCGFETTSTMDYYIYNNGSREYGKSI